MIYHVIRCPHCGVKFLLWQHRYDWQCGKCKKEIILGPKFGEIRKGKKMDEKKAIAGKFRFDQDSKRFHRFQMETDVGIVGTL